MPPPPTPSPPFLVESYLKLKIWYSSGHHPVRRRSVSVRTGKPCVSTWCLGETTITIINFYLGVAALKFLCFIFLYLHIFSAAEHVLYGKAFYKYTLYYFYFIIIIIIIIIIVVVVVVVIKQICLWDTQFMLLGVKKLGNPKQPGQHTC